MNHGWGDNEFCSICKAVLKDDRQKFLEICCRCEILRHPCSTGDCPHEEAGECALALDDLKLDQNESHQI